MLKRIDSEQHTAPQRRELREDGGDGDHPTGLDLNHPASTRPHPRRRPLAQPPQCPDPLPRPIRLPRRGPTQRRHPAPVPTALRRLRPPVGLCDLPRQPRRLPGQPPAHRSARRHPPRSPRLRLRALPQRPHRLDTQYTDVTPGRTTSPRRAGRATGAAPRAGRRPSQALSAPTAASPSAGRRVRPRS